MLRPSLEKLSAVSNTFPSSSLNVSPSLSCERGDFTADAWKRKSGGRNRQEKTRISATASEWQCKRQCQPHCRALTLTLTLILGLETLPPSKTLFVL